MNDQPTVDELLARLARVEARAAELDRQINGTPAQETSAGNHQQHQDRNKVSRAGFLTKAGLTAAGVTGLALLAPRQVKDAYAVTTDTNFVASGSATSGFDSGPGNFSNGVWGHGSNNGVAGQGGNYGGWFSGQKAQIVLVPGGFPGPPTTGIHYKGEVYLDSNGTIWVCTTGDGSNAGTFTPLQPGGYATAVRWVVGTGQYHLSGSDGATWVAMDPGLAMPVNQPFGCDAIFTANADLWTATAGYNQDIGIWISGGTFGSGQLLGWKESGGFAGAFSPNAAFLEVGVGLAANTLYNVSLVWKMNKRAASSVSIYAGAGPIGADYSPTRLGARFVPTA